ncbi:RILP-like protein 1 isoform X3 [Conger conger]|uniref:RILP-like protein 1 isoform X2 n=1 Tax=Conger conger TaxID=82655 RepID=UPI002A5AAFF6|nr:RILP-like protein 1 isoform X2 [Conger conger]XP_061115652.1 RILP-like protein 1 isoform X3 [Conger conger]
MEDFGAALEKNAAELTVMDVYDIAAVVGQEFERIIDQYGCEALARLMPKVVRVLEILEVLVSRNNISPETEELRLELDRLRLERIDRLEKEKKHQKELELVEDVWRGEAQDLLSQIAQLQEENKSLLTNLSLQDCPTLEEELQKQEGVSERERQVMNKLKEVVDRQRDEIRAKDRELALRSEDVEALQQQQARLMKMNQDLRHRKATLEAQGKALIQQRVELEAQAQARQQELGQLQREVAQLRERLQGEGRPDGEEPPLATPPGSTATPPSSIWAECGGGRAGGLAECFGAGFSLPPGPEDGGLVEEEEEGRGDEEEQEEVVLRQGEPEEDPGEDSGASDLKDPSRPRFTLQELRDVLHERNELKAKVFMLQEEITYYRSEEELEEEEGPAPSLPAPAPRPNVQPESGIKRLIFTAIMPMVAAGLIADDPTLQPIRRLISFV